MLASFATLMCTGAIGAPSPPQAASEQAVVMRLRAHADINRGRQIFDTCAACHQSNGAGAVDGSVPAIAGQRFGFLVHELVSFRHEQRQDERMQHFTDQHHLKDAQAIADVAAYISQLPETRSSNHGSGEALQAGALHYANTCAACHGAGGDGNAQHDVPRIAGQQYEYLLHALLNPADEVRPDFWSVHARVLNGLQRSDLIAIADYVSRLNP